MITFLRSLFLYLFISGTYAAQEPVPLQNPIVMEVSQIKNLTNESVRKSLLAAGNKLGWSIVDKDVGVVRGTLKIRQHEVVVDISYGTQQMSATYISSTNLNFDPTPPPKSVTRESWMYPSAPSGPVIHPNYQRWVNNLFKETNTFLLLVAQLN